MEVRLADSPFSSSQPELLGSAVSDSYVSATQKRQDQLDIILLRAARDVWQ
jgi:hypothetical protein